MTLYTLHPAPCTLHPTPYTLQGVLDIAGGKGAIAFRLQVGPHPAPRTPHPAPRTPHPALQRRKRGML